MGDYGVDYTDKQIKALESHIKSVYGEAKKDLNAKLKKFNEQFKVKDAKHKADLKAGKITKEEYQAWLKGQVFQGDHWKQMKAQMESVLLNANQEAINVVNGGKISVIATNANYMAFDLEHTAGVNLGFALYDRNTVTNLLKEQPDLLPNKHVDPVKDSAWNRKKITRQVTQGILQGESTQQVADRLANVLSSQNMNSMLTTARTAMTSAQNVGRQIRLEEAKDKGIKLKKEWMCTLDTHTRIAHRELDGQKVDVDKKFKWGDYEIAYPADPEAEAFLVYNCRCTMVADLDDFPEVYQRYDNINGVPVDGMTYTEWAKAKEYLKDNPEETPWVDRIKVIQERVAANGLTEEDIMEAGKIFADEMDSVYEEAEAKLRNAEQEEKEAKEQYRIAKKNYEDLRAEIDKNIFLLDDEDIQMKIIELDDIMQQKEQERIDATKKYRSLRYIGDTSAQDLKRKLSEIREVGTDGLDIKGHLNNSRSPMRKHVEYGYDKYPKSWVEQSMGKGTMVVKKTDRGYYRHSNYFQSEIAISGFREDDYNETAMHELGHRFERTVRGISEQETIFYKRRTEGEESVWLGIGYGRHEVTKKDNFLDYYMGKDYGGGAYELVSMGFEYAYTDPLLLKKDKDMQQWILGLLAIVP